jgi:hypothetical protein
MRFPLSGLTLERKASHGTFAAQINCTEIVERHRQLVVAYFHFRGKESNVMRSFPIQRTRNRPPLISTSSPF